MGKTSVDTVHSLGPFLSTSHLPIDHGTHEPEVFFNSLFIYARSKTKATGQGIDAVNVMTHFSHRHHVYLNTWRDVNSAGIKIFIAYLIIMELV